MLEIERKFYKLFAENGCEHIPFPDDLREELRGYMTESWAEIESRVDPEMWKAYNEAVDRYSKEFA
jgi:hypothetical protein